MSRSRDYIGDIPVETADRIMRKRKKRRHLFTDAEIEEMIKAMERMREGRRRKPR